MKRTTSDRLKEYMLIKGIRQSEIIEKCQPFCKEYGVRIGRNDMSQYVSGKVVPRQDKITVLAKALNLDEAWLMGFDVPMTPEHSGQETEDNSTKDAAFVPKTTVERKFVALFRSMGDETEEEKKSFEQYFETTIDMFLAKKGINPEDIE